MTRFPFEEDARFRFGEFHELVHRYIVIGRRPPPARPGPIPHTARHSTPRRERSRPPATRRQPSGAALAIEAGAGMAP